jgi:hypothetical protein
VDIEADALFGEQRPLCRGEGEGAKAGGVRREARAAMLGYMPETAVIMVRSLTSSLTVPYSVPGSSFGRVGPYLFDKTARRNVRPASRC